MSKRKPASQPGQGHLLAEFAWMPAKKSKVKRADVVNESSVVVVTDPKPSLNSSELIHKVSGEFKGGGGHGYGSDDGGNDTGANEASGAENAAAFHGHHSRNGGAVSCQESVQTIGEYIDSTSATPADYTPTAALYVARNLLSLRVLAAACALPDALTVTFHAAEGLTVAKPRPCQRLTPAIYVDIIRQCESLERQWREDRSRLTKDKKVTDDTYYAMRERVGFVMEFASELGWALE